MDKNKIQIKVLIKNLIKVFDTDYSRGLSDKLWKNRVAWVESQASKVKPGSKVLDIGAGECLYKPFFKNCDYTAQDFAQTPNMKYGNIDVVSDITDIPLKSNSFDVILCSEVFEHIPFPEAGLKEIVRLLKPGGKLIFSAPLGSGQHQQPYHYYGGYTRFWYEKFFPENGLKINTITPNGGLYGHTVELLWRSQTRVIPVLQSKGLIGRLLAFWVQIFVYNIPSIVLDYFEDKEVLEDFTPCFFVTATKRIKK